MLGFDPLVTHALVEKPLATTPAPPVVTTTPALPGSNLGVGSRAWSPRKPLTKKKKKLVDELDEALLELRARIAEEPEPVPERKVDLGKLEAAFIGALRGEMSLAQIRSQLAEAHAMLMEMDDEDAILLLAIH